MERRKFLIGVGGTSLGASALIGSGAFTRIESQRRVKIEVAEDPDAYLGLDGCPDSPNSSYTEIDDSGHLAVEMSPKNKNTDNDLGSGINSDSFTWFDNVFQICNQGKEDICVWIDAEVAENLNLDPEYDDENIVDFYPDSDRDRSLVGPENALFLQVGECICVGIATVTKGLEAGDQLLEDDEIVIHADVDCPVEPPENDDNVVDNGRRGISFVAFCVDRQKIPKDASLDDYDFEIIPTLFKPDGDPVEIDWDSDGLPVQTLVLKGGPEFFNYDVDGATSGVQSIGERNTGEQLPGQTPDNPCGFDGDLCNVKFNWSRVEQEFVPDFPTDSCF